MLLGTYEVTFDSAGRMTIPAPVRRQLGDDVPEVVVTQALPPDRYLMLFTPEAFHEYVDRNFPRYTLDRAQRDLKRLVTGRAFSIRIDNANRVLVPQPLRDGAGIEGPARIMGVDDGFEVWAADLHEQWLAETDTPERVMATTAAIAEADLRREREAERTLTGRVT